MTERAAATMKSLRLRSYGAPADVLRVEEAPVPEPAAGQIRVRVLACALNPADWALCAGFFPGAPPRGIGLDVAGVVDALGEGVTNAKAGDRVFGVPDFRHYPSAGAAEYAVLAVWAPIPDGLDAREAAALPMAVETSVRALDLLGLGAGQTILVNGGGTMVGYAAVQIALLRRARVIATAGDTFAARLRELGAAVTPYGDGMVERVRTLAGGAPDMVFNTAFAGSVRDLANGGKQRGSASAASVLPDLIAIAGGDPARVMSVSDFDKDGLGVRTTGREPNVVLRYDALAEYARLAAEGRFSVPVARVFDLEDWRAAAELSLSGRAHGKLVLVP